MILAAHSLTFGCALLPNGWADDVKIAIDIGGNILSVEPGTKGGARDGDIAIPGMANVHSHAHQRAMAGLAETAGPGANSFWTWREIMYRHLRLIGPEELEAIAAQLYLEALKSGFTAIGEFQYLHHQPDGTPYDQRALMTLACIHAARSAGIGFTALPVLYTYSGFGALPPGDEQRRFVNDGAEFLRIVEDCSAELSDDPNGSLGIAPHSLRAVDAGLLTEAISGLDGIDQNAPIHIHISEQIAEVDECLAWSGRRPVEWLLDEVPVSGRWCAIHATHLNNAEITRLAASGAVAGLCPTTEANLGDGLFPARRFLDADGAIAIGSDSHISVSVAEDLRLLEYGQRLTTHARNVLAGGPGSSTGRSLFDQCLAGGAGALNRQIGCLQPGSRADIVVLDKNHPALIGRNRDAILDSWIFSGGDNCVKDVYVGGARAIHDGRHAGEQEIKARYARAVDRLVS